MWFEYGSSALLYVFLGVVGLVSVLVLWLVDVVSEGFCGYHTCVVQRGFRAGFALFLFTEVMFFVSIFWVYFDASLCPSVWVGGVWPPVGVSPVSPFGLPLFNTFLLLSSGVVLTWAHSLLLCGLPCWVPLIVTLSFAIVFLLVQGYEYCWSSFSISDGVYGSIFFFGTGCHGAHVLLGALALLVCFVRLCWGHFTPTQHMGLEFSVVYWHFVDVVWVALWLVFYYWGGS